MNKFQPKTVSTVQQDAETPLCTPTCAWRYCSGSRSISPPFHRSRADLQSRQPGPSISKVALEHMALIEIRTRYGCEDVRSVKIDATINESLAPTIKTRSCNVINMNPATTIGPL